MWICIVKREKQVPCFAVETSRGVCFCFSSTRSIGLISGQTHVCSSPIIWRKIHIFGFFFSFTINYRNQPAFYSVFKQYMKIYQIYAGLQPNPSLMGTLNVHQYDEFSHLYNVHYPSSHIDYILRKKLIIWALAQQSTHYAGQWHIYEALLQCSIYMWNNNDCSECEIVKSVRVFVAGFLCAENWISLQRKMIFLLSALDFIRWYCRQSSKLLLNKKRDGTTFKT